MFNSVEDSSNFPEATDLVKLLGQEPLTPVAEGRIYIEWTRRINSTTGKRFRLYEIALVTNRSYGQVRNRASLVQPYDPNAEVPYERIGEVDLSQASIWKYLKGSTI